MSRPHIVFGENRKKFFFQGLVKISKAQRFYTKDKAQDFIDGFNEYGKYLIVNPEIKEVVRRLTLSE